MGNWNYVARSLVSTERAPGGLVSTEVHQGSDLRVRLVWVPIVLVAERGALRLWAGEGSRDRLTLVTAASVKCLACLMCLNSWAREGKADEH